MSVLKNPKSGVSDNLKSALQKISSLTEANDFALGGGTNLAYKFNHRVSIDMDFFSNNVVGINTMEALFEKINESFPNSILEKLNFKSDNLSWIKGVLVHNGEAIKVEFIQNIGLLHNVKESEGIRLIDDMDIGSLKLEAVANRGTKKDFYDLYLLGKYYDLSAFHEDYMERRMLFDGNRMSNIFNETPHTKAMELSTELTELINFNNTKDLRSPNNQILLTANTPIKDSWYDIQQQWKKWVESLGVKKGLKVGEVESIPIRRKKLGGREFKL